MSREGLSQMKITVPWWIAGQPREHGVAEPFVEHARRKVERPERCAAAAALDCLRFGGAHQLASETAAAQLLRDPEAVDHEPLPHRRAVHAADEHSAAHSQSEAQW